MLLHVRANGSKVREAEALLATLINDALTR
jgi:hypothetical protein